jgi:hypothetical protein
LPFDHLHGRLRGLVLKSFHGFEGDLTGGQFHAERAGLVEHPIARSAYARVRVYRGVVLAVRRSEMNPRRTGSACRRIDRPTGQNAHGPFPAAPAHRDFLECTAVRLEQLDLWQTAFVGDERNPLAVRRPARMKGVVLKERQLVRLST